ncbi:MAG TPA: endonuclease III [Sediminispirochaeta sp.]|nr:endonuclease III [Sediminispirochaeta sp.]
MRREGVDFGVRDYAEVVRRVKISVEEHQVPSVTEVAGISMDPFEILISTLISLRTKDEVTAQAAKRLFARADDPRKMVELGVEEIQRLIYPAGFYRNKARNIVKISEILIDRYQGTVPDSQEALMNLPGVGLKTANLTLSLAFRQDYICVDIHVHRISNRLGWVKTENPDQTEKELQKVLPREHWIEINELFVRFGRSVCTPVSPWCSKCPLDVACPKIGVKKKR